MRDFFRFFLAFLYGVLVVFFVTTAFAQEYQKVKYTVVIRGSPYGEYTMSDWIDDKKVPEFFTLVGIDQSKVEDGLTAWEAAEKYAKDHPAPYVPPTKQDYLNLYNERLAEADSYLGLYSANATKEELGKVKTALEQKVTALADTIATKVTLAVIDE